MLTTTTEKIRAQSPCNDGYRKLLTSLEKTKPDSEPVSFIKILESNGLNDALWCLRAELENKEVQKNARLFAVFCARQHEHLLTDEYSILAINVAERFANGGATAEELASAAAASAAGAAAGAAGAAWAAGAAGTAGAAAAAAASAAGAASAAAAWAAAASAAAASAAGAAGAAGTAGAAQEQEFIRLFGEYRA